MVYQSFSDRLKPFEDKDQNEASDVVAADMLIQKANLN